MKTWTHQLFQSRRLHVFVGSVSFMVMFGLIGCSSSTTPAGTTVKADVSGQVTSLTSSHRRNGKRIAHQRASQSLATHTGNGCASAACTTLVVGSGGNGTAGPSCSVDADGNFTINGVPVGEQLEATFACTGGSQKCIVMSGDAGATCDPVSDAVIQAFLPLVGVTSLADSSLAKANIAQIAASIDQAAQTGTTAADTFLNAITACAGDATCDSTAIKASPFFGPFRLMKTQVDGWDVESIFTLLTDVMGYTVQIDPFTYTAFGTNIDLWLGTDFVASTRTFVAAMLADQTTTHLNTYVTEVVCQAQYNKGFSSGTITYIPSLISVTDVVSGIVTTNVPSCTESDSDATVALAKNGLTGAQIDIINAAIASGSGGGQNQLTSGLTNMDCGGGNATSFCMNTPQLLIMSKATEPNRNDPLGTNNNNFIQQTNISMINVFPAVQTALQNAVPPTDTTVSPAPPQVKCMSMGGGGGPDVNNDTFCNNWFGTLIAPYKKDFSGAIGLYMALKDHSLGANSLLSLNDLYTIFSGGNFLGMKLTNQSNFSWGVNYYTGSGSMGPTNGLQSLLNDPNPTAAYTGTFTLDPAFNSNNSTAITKSTAEGLYTSATFGFNDSFQMFEQIPTASNIHDYIFKSAYHVDYNPTGNSTYFAAGSAVAPTSGSSSNPIFCKMTEGVSGAPVEEDMATDPNAYITCNDANTLGVTVDASGNLTTPSDFSYPYTLTQWGFQGNSAGEIFQLVDWRTGFQIMPNGHQQFVYQKSGGNPGTACVGSGANTIVTANITVGNGANGSSSQLITAFCMDMTTPGWASTGALGFYNGGNVQFSQNNPNCVGCTMNAGVVGGLNTSVNATNYSTPPVCVFAAANAFTVTGGVAVAGSDAGGMAIAGAMAISPVLPGQITTLGTSLVVDYCSLASTTYSADTEYQLISVNGWGAADTAHLYAELLPVTAGATPLLWKAMPTTVGAFDTSSYYLTVDAADLTTAFAATYSGSSATTSNCQVSPNSTPTQVQGISLANPAWEAKFDPFCDNIEGDGVCHCLDGTTNAAKSGSACTLEDVPTDPTMSSPPYFIMPGTPPTLPLAFFANYGGKAGTQLAVTGTGLNWSSTTWTGSTGASIQSLNLNNAIFRCQYLITGQTAYGTPQYVTNVWSHNQPGCPDSSGAVTTFTCNSDCPGASGSVAATGGGPMAIVNPVPMNNAYAVLKPNATVKVANYATKDTGQGITIDPTAKVFTFDTGLALMAFRTQFPLANITVTSGGQTVPGALGAFQQVNNPANAGSDNNNSNDPLGSVLCFLADSSGSACASHGIQQPQHPGFVARMKRMVSSMTKH